MISYRSADILERFKKNNPEGRMNVHFIVTYDEFTDGSRKYFVGTDTSLDPTECNDAFVIGIGDVLRACGFKQEDFGDWRCYDPESFNNDSYNNEENFFGKKLGDIETELTMNGFHFNESVDQNEANLRIEK